MQYTVQLQFDVLSVDLADITVEANTPKEAQLLAKQAYHEGTAELDYYQSNWYESELTEDYSLWEVTKHN